MADPDHALRSAAFARLSALQSIWGEVLPWEVIAEPWLEGAAEMRFANRARGIFKPAEVRSAVNAPPKSSTLSRGGVLARGFSR